MKKTACFLLAILMCVSILSACASENTGSDTGTTAAAVDSGAAATETQDDYGKDNLPAGLNLGGVTIRMLSREHYWVNSELTVESLTGEPVNDAVYNRQKLVEDRLGCTLVNTKFGGNTASGVTDEFTRLMLANEDEYDIVSNSAYHIYTTCASNYWNNLLDVEYLDLDQPWWAQNFKSEASMGKGLYFTTGALALSMRQFLVVTFYNKSIAKDNGIEDLYALVKSGKWTIDKENDIVKGLYSDLNGNGKSDEEDRFGCITNNEINSDAYWSCFDLNILSKDADNFPTLDVNIEKVSGAIDKINYLDWENPGTYTVLYSSSTGDSVMIDTQEKKFSADGGLFMINRLLSAESESLRGMASDYGIIPMPKYDENQTGYYTYAHDQYSIFGIPITVKDTAPIGAFLEAFCSESYKSVVPAYYEIALKSKYVRDEESSEMLDIITNGFLVDCGWMWSSSISNYPWLIRSIVKTKSNNFSSQSAAYTKVVDKMLVKLSEKFTAFQN